MLPSPLPRLPIVLSSLLSIVPKGSVSGLLLIPITLRILVGLR
jgi:hypothetical protein